MHSKTFEASETYWEQQISEKILRYVRDELYLELRFLGTALSTLEYRPDTRLTTIATDGEVMYYGTEQILRLFQNNPAYLDRIYLHSVLHCLFSHLWLADDRNPFLWGISCDIAVEYTIDHMDTECTRRILSLARRQIYEKFEKKEVGISAAQIYRYLWELPETDQQELHQEFFADDHVFWPKKEQLSQKSKMLQSKWGRISRQISLKQKKRGTQLADGEEMITYQIKAAKSRRSYRDFLRKFMVLREEMHIDQDEFDLGYYTYGIALYKNVPLIEPLESRETKKIRDFVVVIDTSYSTSGELIQGFLKETFRLMKEQDYFFSRGKLHLIQADESVHEDILLQSEEDIERLFQDFTIQGGGGTDFRPAFQYVNSLVEQGHFDDLCGLLYFTDGKGIYPEQKPVYQSAFLFLEDYDAKQIPAWAMQLRLEPEELMENILKER